MARLRMPIRYVGDQIMEDGLVGIRPVRPPDIPVLRAIESDESVAGFWRLNGHTISLAEYSRSLFAGVACQRVIYGCRSGETAGLGSGYAYSPTNQTMWLSVIASRQRAVRGEALGGLRIMIAYLFDNWPLRKLYADASDEALQQYRHVIGNGFKIEAVLPHFYDTPGLRGSKTILSTTREEFTRNWL